MTREETKNLIVVMQAYVAGEQIQYTDAESEDWTDIESPEWDPNYDYRIKPEPKYRSFKNAEECWQEMLKHQPFGWIKSKRDDHYSMVTMVGADYKMKCVSISGDHIWPFDETMSDYTFADGTPFGVRENF